MLNFLLGSVKEVRHAVRMLIRNPGFTAVATISLAFGIGANCAMFSLADALLLRPLPVLEPSAVAAIDTYTPDKPARAISYPEYRDLRAKIKSFSGLVAFQLGTFGVATSATELPQIRMGMMVSDNFFQVLGIRPAPGRGLLPNEGKVQGRDAVAVLSYDFWTSQFSQNPGIIGRTIRINGIDFNVIGVGPKAFTGMDQYIRPALYVPATMAQRLTGAPADPLENRAADSFIVKGRLQPGASRESAQAELSTIWKSLATQYPETTRNRNVAVRTELQARIQQSPPDAMLVGMLMALVGLVLIIACANVANLMLGRARSRSREIAIRIAIGVGRMRLLRQLLTESLVLSFVSALVGLALADSGIRALQNIRPPSDLPIVISPQLDHRVLLFTLLASVLSAIFFGLAPASQTFKMELVPALKGASLGFSAGSRTLGRSALVVAQVALSMVLLVAAGMLLDGFQRSLVLNPGYRTDHLMMFEFETSLVRYTPAQTRDFYRNLVYRTRALPDVRSTTLARSIPFSPSQFVTNVVPEGYQFPKGQISVSIFTNVVDEHYFATTKMPVIDGREFAASDKSESRRVAIVNEQFAKTYWPGQNPIGKRLKMNDAGGGPWMDVVGIAKTAKYLFIGETATPFLYIPFAQHQTARMTLIVETYGDPAFIAGPVRDVVRSLDPSQPVYNVRTFASHYQQRAIAIPRLIMQTVGGMGLLGLTLALVGIYGLIAYSVSRRTREIGIRMAIGGNKASILRMVLHQGFKLSLLGILAGSLVSFGVGRVLAAGLAGIGAPNPLTFVIVPIALIVITLTACYIPARRASLIDPVKALRHE